MSWVTRKELPIDLQFTVEMLGMQSTRSEMEKAGWEFISRVNNFTKKEKITAQYKKSILASGSLKDGKLTLCNLCNSRYGKKLNAEFVKDAQNDVILLEELPMLDVLDAILSYQKAETVKKKSTPRQKAKTIELEKLYTKAGFSSHSPVELLQWLKSA